MMLLPPPGSSSASSPITGALNAETAIAAVTAHANIFFTFIFCPPLYVGFLCGRPAAFVIFIINIYIFISIVFWYFYVHFVHIYNYIYLKLFNLHIFSPSLPALCTLFYFLFHKRLYKFLYKLFLNSQITLYKYHLYNLIKKGTPEHFRDFWDSFS